jgi:enoyl-CoA hydratase/carnithine racemase
LRAPRAETALRVGLVTEVLPRADLLARAQRLAAIVADYDSVAVQGTLKAIWESLELGRKAAIERAPLYSDATRASSGHSLAEATTAARSHWTR